MPIPHLRYFKNLNLNSLTPADEINIISKANEFKIYSDKQFLINNKVLQQKNCKSNGFEFTYTKIMSNHNKRYPDMTLQEAMKKQQNGQPDVLPDEAIVRKIIKKAFKVIQKKKYEKSSNVNNKRSKKNKNVKNKSNVRTFTSDGTIQNVTASGYVGSPPDPVIETNGTICMGLSNNLVPMVYDFDLNSISSGETLSGLQSKCCDPTINWDEYDQQWFVTALSPGVTFWRSSGSTLTGWESKTIYTFSDYQKSAVYPNHYVVTDQGGSGTDRDIYLLSKDWAEPSIKISTSMQNYGGNFFNTWSPVDGKSGASTGTDLECFCVRGLDDESSSLAEADSGTDFIQVAKITLPGGFGSDNVPVVAIQSVQCPEHNAIMGGLSSWYQIRQPGTSMKLDVVQQIPMNLSVMRQIRGEIYAWVCLSAGVEDNGTGWTRSSLIWSIMKYNGNNWSAFQSGIINGPNNEDCWLPSATMDERGYVFISVCISGPNHYPSTYVTGKGLNTPDFPELQPNSMGTSSCTQTGGRWGDYYQSSTVNAGTFIWSSQVGQNNTYRVEHSKLVAYTDPTPQDLLNAIVGSGTLTETQTEVTAGVNQIMTVREIVLDLN